MKISTASCPINQSAGACCLYQINGHRWEGKYSPRDADRNRISRDVYAKTREECEEKLATMIEEMKKEIAVEKEGVKTAKWHHHQMCQSLHIW